MLVQGLLRVSLGSIGPESNSIWGLLTLYFGLGEHLLGAGFRVSLGFIQALFRTYSGLV